MNTTRPSFCNFQVDHMTLLLQPQLYNVAYVLFRVVFGVPPEEILYEKRKAWKPGTQEDSMTYAVRIGQGASKMEEMNNTVIAVVQPSEPKSMSSHVREMLNSHKAAAHWQHIALRTDDLLAFHEHAKALGINFITPILKDDGEDLIQVFSGEWFFPEISPSGMFFEFLQRNPTPELMKKIEEHNRESWFRDETFLGLYGEKEKEYQSGNVTPFIDFKLFQALYERVGNKKMWEIGDKDIQEAETVMREYAKKNAKA